MPELRWTLLILGALFIGALAIWELRRQRHARGQQLAQGREGEPEGRVYREPTMTLPDVPADSRGGFHVGSADFTRDEASAVAGRIEPADRERISDPPVVELDDESLAGLKVDRQQVVDEFSTHTIAVEDDARDADGDEETGQDEPDRYESDLGDADHIGSRRVEPHIPELSPVHDASPLVENVPLPSEPIVEWPDEDTRQIIALRLVSGVGERFAGRAVRLALAAEGFLLGKFDIFHKPGPDARAVLSAASLTKPGTFSLGTMDAQRFGGLSLFAVLPGPLSPLATFDELLATARGLNNRLRGALQDERGEPLTPVRSASIRESLTASASAAAPVVGPPAAVPAPRAEADGAGSP